MRECGIVRDLLPLYQEGMLSPDSVEFLEEQIGCPIKMVSNGPRREEMMFR